MANFYFSVVTVKSCLASKLLASPCIFESGLDKCLETDDERQDTDNQDRKCHTKFAGRERRLRGLVYPRNGFGLNRFICCAADKGEPLPAIDDVVAAIVTDSPAYDTDLASWNEIAADYLRLLHERQKPILGVCYGHQLLAWAFGGVVGFHPNG